MGHKLIVHIGMPKTGTSAIQEFAFNNQDLLKLEGICYPDLVTDMKSQGYLTECRKEGRSKNGVVLGHFRTWSSHNDMNPLSKDEWNIFSNILSGYLENYDVIISDEDLWCQGNNYAIIRALKSVAKSMDIVVYLRRQDLEVEAVWNQVVKRYGYCADKFNPFGKDRWEKERVLKYLDILDHIAQIVGMEHMYVRVYEREQMYGNNGDVVDDFLETIGISNKEEYVRIKGINERLSGSPLNIKLAMNQCLNRDDWISGNIEEYFIEATQSLCTNVEEGYYTMDERLALIDKFSAENEIIAKKYLNRQDGILFKEEVKNKKYHSDRIELEDIIKIFTFIQIEQERKMRKLDLRIGEMERKFKRKILSRKLTLFGAGLICRKFLSTCSVKVDLVLDNNEAKSGSKVNGINIKHPKQIDDWNNRFIIITCGACRDIENQLSKLGLEKGIDFIRYEEKS